MPLPRKTKQYRAPESQKLYKLLIKHGIAENTAQKIVELYEG